MTLPLPVSVVIPTRNRADFLRDTVESILAGNDLPAELIVADQSTEPLAALPDAEGVTLKHLPLHSVGPSRARNEGIAASSRDVLVFTDDDVRVEPDWLGKLVSALEKAPPRTVVTGRVLAEAAEGHVPSITYRDQAQTFTGRVFADPLFPINMAVPRSAFDEVGLFDTRLGAGTPSPNSEDNDFGFRLLEAGYDIAFVPEPVVHHRGARGGRALAKLEWAYGRGQGAFYAKHMRRSDRHMARRFWRNARYRARRTAPLARGDRKAAREAIYLAGLFWGAIGWWRRYGFKSTAV